MTHPTPTSGAADLPDALRPVELGALIASIQELNAWESRADGELLTQAEGESIILVLHELQRLIALAAGQAVAPAVLTSATGGDWMQPTTIAQRLGDAVQLLCGGKRPSEAMVAGWLGHSSEELQSFCAEHGPAWAQGIGLIDAAMVMVDQPTGILTPESAVDHERTEDAPAQPVVEPTNGTAYAELTDERAAFEAWYIAQVRSKTSATNDWSDNEIRGAWLSRPSDAYRSSFAWQSWEAWQARASHGQAPAQPAGPCAICGSDEPFTGTCGSGDPRALCKQPSTSPQAAQPIACSYGDNGYACCDGGPCRADLYNDSLSTAQAAPTPVLHLVHSAFAEIAMAFPKAFALHKVGIADTEVREALAAPAGVLEDAARWHWMAEYIVGTRTDLDDELIASATVDELRKLVDADLAARAPAESVPAPVVDKCTKQQMTTEVLRRMQQQEDGHNKNPFRSLLDRLMRNEGGYSTIEIGQLKYALDGFYGADRAPADSVPAPAGGIPGNHWAAWRKALEIAKTHATGDDVTYWDHELRAFDRSFDRLLALMQAPTPPAQVADNVLADSAEPAVQDDASRSRTGAAAMSAGTTLAPGDALEPVASLKWDGSADGTYFAQLTVSGLRSEQQAQAAVAHMRRLFCGQEQEPSQ